MDITINLEVQEVCTFEDMVVISKGATGAEAAGTLVPGTVGVAAQLNIQAVI